MPVANEHVPPLLVSDIVTVVPVVEPVAAQFTKPPVIAIVGVAGIANPAGKTAVTVFGPDRAVVLILKLTVQVVSAYATCDVPANATLDTTAFVGEADPNRTAPATAPASTKRRAWRKLEPNPIAPL